MFTKTILFSLLSSFAVAGVINGAHNVAHIEYRAANICGQKGYDRGSGTNYDYDGSGKFSTLAECSKRCLNSVKCQSFGYGGKECMLFSGTLANNFDADPDSEDIYYDRDCTIPGSQSNPVKSSSSSSSSKTSTTSKASSTTSKAQAASSTSSTSTTKTTTPSAAAATSTTTSSLATSTSQASTSSTTQQSSSGSSSSTSTSTAPVSTVSYYPGCKAGDFKMTYDITSLSWFNSTNNLNCAVNGQPNYDSTAKVCVDTATNTLCDASKAGASSTCKCQAYCDPTAPSAAFQPPGYGPPDTISISIADFAYPTCTESNPQTPKEGIGALGNAEIGNGDVNCGPKHNYLNFFGDSNPGREQGRVLFIPGASCGGHLALYEATFPLSCTRDAAGNASCVPKSLPVTVSLTRFAAGQCASCAGSLIQ